jgi:signal transduction histidine kinase
MAPAIVWWTRMRPRRSLRFGITLTLLLFVSASSGLFALAMDHVNDRMERSLLDDALDLEFEEFAGYYRREQQLPPSHSSHVRFYMAEAGEKDSLPPPLRRLALGQHHEIRFDDRRHHVLHRMLDDWHVYIALDITKNEVREDRFKLFLLLGVVLASAVAVWVGYLLSRRLIAPVTELAARVSQVEPGATPSALAHEFAGAEVEVIAQAFDRFLQRLDRFIDREHAFTEDASHELRTPLAVINSASELLLAEQGLPEKIRKPLLRIRRASRQMTRLTSALLFLARESGEHADRQHCQAEEVIVETVAAHRQSTNRHAVEIRLEALEPTPLSAPPEFLEIVIANLLQNAMAHTSIGQIRVALVSGVLTIEDSGSGIPPADLPRIFERNFRGVESRGIGRGLDLVKRICDRYGWRIEVASQPGRGTRFSIFMNPTSMP